LKWKRQKPLHVLLLRVYELDTPVRVPILESYSGCKSWLRLEGEFAPGGMKPVVDDERFGQLVRQIERLLVG
jgi:hypothetical protein